MNSSPVLAVTLNTFREAVRDRILYNLVAFAVILIASAVLFGQISIGIEKIILINLGLSSISVFGLLIAIFLGINLVFKEIDKRSLYALLSKPVRRWQFLLGKFLGLNVTLLVNTIFMTAGFWAALYYLNRKFERQDQFIWVAIYFILLELSLVTAICLFFSCFSTPVLSAVFTFLLYIIGSFSADIRGFGELTHSAPLKALSTFVYYLVPNFSDFSVAAPVAHGKAVPGTLVLLNTIYTLCYASVLLVASMAVFSRKDLK
ncbi:MAG: ABC transporter permease subunit [Acidobacteria bacterium]|nr:ABC transporter permease subunit [Acidobacteriota bacterium]